MTTPSTSFTPFVSGAAPRAHAGGNAPGAVLIFPFTRHAAQIIRHARDRWRAWTMRLNDRCYLASLQDFEVQEMGMTLDQRDSEVKKPFWEA